MSESWIACYKEDDLPYGEEVHVSIAETESGYVAVPDNGEDLYLTPAQSVEEAKEDLQCIFAGWDTFQWLDEN